MVNLYRVRMDEAKPRHNTKFMRQLKNHAAYAILQKGVICSVFREGTKPVISSLMGHFFTTTTWDNKAVHSKCSYHRPQFKGTETLLRFSRFSTKRSLYILNKSKIESIMQVSTVHEKNHIPSTSSRWFAKRILFSSKQFCNRLRPHHVFIIRYNVI